MDETIVVVFDGEVFRPEHPVNLKTNSRHVVVVTHEAESASVNSAWDVLDDLDGTIDAPNDWSQEHDHYLYGTPKQHVEGNE